MIGQVGLDTGFEVVDDGNERLGPFDDAIFIRTEEHTGNPSQQKALTMSI